MMGETPASNQVTFSMLLAGYKAAYGRYHDASKGGDATATFVSIFEALNWATSIDERIGRAWRPRGTALGFGWRNEVSEGRLMRGLRFARNSTHHDWADALVITTGRQYPKTYPVVYFEWSWRPASELPAAKDTRGQAEYSELMAGRTARAALIGLSELFDKLATDVGEPT
jgi:hypothetical protein